MDQITKYFDSISQDKLDKLAMLGPLYADWNSKINLISRKDMDNFYHNHVLHSLSIAKFVQFKAATKIIDAGTGGGFPGVPLAIMFPEIEFVLVDSTNKKLAAVNDITSRLELKNIQTIHSRIEDLSISCDFVVSRAVTRLDIMWDWVEKLINSSSQNTIKNGLIYLKGGDISGEVPNNTFIQKIDLNELFDDTVFNEKSLVYITKQQG